MFCNKWILLLLLLGDSRNVGEVVCGSIFDICYKSQHSICSKSEYK